ncbi:MAG: pentapeptide repeat-containing protein, partial [Rhodospirillaceae bacterium]
MSGRDEGKGDGATGDEFDATFGLRRLTQTELEEVCRRHLRFLRGSHGGARANLSLTDLSHLDLTGRDLSNAELNGARLFRTRLGG